MTSLAAPLAQIEALPPALDIAAVLGVVAFLLLIYNQFKAAFGVNPPLHKSYASKDDLTQVHGRIKRERDEINIAIAKIEAAAAAAAHRVDGELHAIRDSIDAVGTAGEARVQRLEDKLDEQTKLIISVIRTEAAKR